MSTVSKTIEELQLKWKNQNPVIMGKGLRMPQFEITDIRASDCQESFQIGEFQMASKIFQNLVSDFGCVLLLQRKKE